MRNNTPFFYATVLAIFFTLLYLILIPPCEAPDEPAHFARAYGIIEGQLVLKDHPKEMLEFVQEKMKRHKEFSKFISNILQKDQERFKNLAFNTALYSPLPYIFHASAIKIASIVFNTSHKYSIYFYAARLASLLLFLGVALWMYKYPINHKWITFWIFANPMALAQAGTINLDIVIFCASILILLSTFFIEQTKKNYTVVVAGFFLMLSKPVFTPILILPLLNLLLIESDKKYIKSIKLIISYAAILLSGLIWSLVSNKYGILQHYIQAASSAPLSPQKHLEHVLTAPVDFLNIVLNTMVQDGIKLYHQFVGVLAWLDVPVPGWVTILWGVYAILILFFISYEKKGVSRKKTNVLGFSFVFIALFSFFLVVLSGYMLWTPIDLRRIPLQGRYFHVIFATLFIGLALLMPRFKISLVKIVNFEWSILLIFILIHCATLYTLLNKFYL